MYYWMENRMVFTEVRKTSMKSYQPFLKICNSLFSCSVTAWYSQQVLALYFCQMQNLRYCSHHEWNVTNSIAIRICDQICDTIAHFSNSSFINNYNLLSQMYALAKFQPMPFRVMALQSRNSKMIDL